MERTLVIIKPDGLKKGLKESHIIEDSDLQIIQTKCLTPTIEQAQKHYIEHEGKEFFQRITKHLSCGNVTIIIIEGKDAIKRVRAIIGSRNDPTTLRGKYSNPDVSHENGIHGSDSIESAKREIALWF